MQHLINSPQQNCIHERPTTRPPGILRMMLGGSKSVAYNAYHAIQTRISELELQLENNPQQQDILSDLGDLYLQINSYDEAEYMFSLLQHAYPKEISGYIGLVNVHLHRGTLEAAAHKAQQAVQLFPNSPKILAAYGAALFLMADYQRACSYYEKASLLSTPPPAWILSAHGLVLQTLGRLHDAKDLLERATVLDPSNGNAWVNLGLVLSDLGNYTSAIQCYDRALMLSPGDEAARLNKALALLTIGDFRRGWREYEARWTKLDVQQTFHQPLWSGQRLRSESLIVYGEQGLGDEIMFSSCIPDVLLLVSCLFIECDDRLYTLFVRSFPQATVVSRSMTQEVNWKSRICSTDFQIPMGSLPLHFRDSIDQFGRSLSYLKADPKRVCLWKKVLDQLGNNPKIGVSWRGGTTFSHRERRSIPLAEFQPILQTPGYIFVNLQYDTTNEELAAIEKTTGLTIHNYPDALSNYDETAALVKTLDLVITVQTAVAHLAGALGCATWIMLPFSPEWRYGAQGTTMPWYPSMRSFRQISRGNWTEVIEDVAACLNTQFGLRMEG